MLKIYLTDLAAYNCGALVGKWITMPMEEIELHQVINEVLSEGEIAVNGENHEEWFISDFEWENIDLFDVEEYENIFELNSKLLLLQELDPNQMKRVKFILDEQYTYDIEDAILKAEDVIVYENTTLEDVAYDLIQDCYDIESLPSIITTNIDYSGIASDLEMDGNYYIVDDDIFEYLG